MIEEEKKANGVSWVEVTAHHVGQRVDNFLISYLKGVPKSLIYKIVRKGEVRVNKKRVKPEYRLCLADLVRIPPVVKSEKKQLVVREDLLAFLKSQMLYEDEDLLILNKPSGLAVHSGSGLEFGVIEALRSAYPQTEGYFLQLAHRLDRDTSGCLVIAKNRITLVELQKLFHDHEVKKIYLALTDGHWSKDECYVDLALNKGVVQSGERMVRVAEEGKAAATWFTPIQEFATCSLTEVIITTGRTHQIRVHAQYQDHCIAGDDKYGDKKFNEAMRNLGLRRLFLHAASIEFTLPSSQKVIKVHAALDEKLSNVLKALESICVIN